MKAKSKKSIKTRKSKTPQEEKSILRRPTTWVMATLLFLLLFVSGISLYGFKALGPSNKLEKAELAVFPHIAKMYIKDMEFTIGEQETIKQATGYGISDEDNVLYITFDFAPYPTERNYQMSELNMRHAIVYFQWDAERNTYGHAFSYHDDASYHPDGLYVKIAE